MQAAQHTPSDDVSISVHRSIDLVTGSDGRMQVGPSTYYGRTVSQEFGEVLTVSCHRSIAAAVNAAALSLPAEIDCVDVLYHEDGGRRAICQTLRAGWTYGRAELVAERLVSTAE